jgi:hypothetical protein
MSAAVPQVERIARDYGITVVSSGDFDPTIVKHEIAELVKDWPAVEISHLGDHDPSGVHLLSALAKDVHAFTGPEHDIRFTRLAVTPDQIEELGLPTVPPKTTDRRSFHGETVQAEAIAPDVLAEIIRGAITSRIDPAAPAEVLAAYGAARAELSPILQAIKGGAP